MTGTEFLEVGFQAFVVGLIVGAIVGALKNIIHNATN
jgi:hypothetical protein